LNNYLFLGLFLGVAITAGVVMFMLTPKDDILFPGLSPQSGVQANLQKMYEQGLIDRAGNLLIINQIQLVTILYLR
jgi:hypothetical protein